MKKDIKWAPIFPLIGGFPLGAENALGTPPVAVFSAEGFWGNDSHYMNYQNNVLGRNIPYIKIDEDGAKNYDLDILVATPPCAALSQLNTGKSDSVRGADAQQNEWLYEAAYHGFATNTKVIIAENAPALFTNKGKGVAERLNKIAKDHGYAFSLYKTSTHFHGLPQRRDRTFYFMWKSDTAPILNWHRKEHPTFADYLKLVSDDDLQQDIVVNPNVHNEPYYEFVKHKLGKNDVRSDILEANCNTALNYVIGKGLLEEANKWFHETGNERGIKYSDRALYKFSIGKGVWDSSTHVFGERMNAVIGRNLNDTIHPTQDRSLTIREALHMMGFPKDFELLGGRSKSNMIAQNVPTCTAADMVREATAFLNGNRILSNSRYVRQDNWKEKIEYVEESATLDGLFA